MKQPTSNSPQHLNNWERAFLPVLRGEAPRGTRSLRALADANELDQLIPWIASHASSSDRTAALDVIHCAVYMIADTLLSSAALDGVTIAGTSDQLGMVFADNGALSAFWIAENIGIQQGVLVNQLADQLTAFLQPIVAAVQTREHIGRRALELVLFDAVRKCCRRLNNGHVVQLERGWVDDLLIAMGDVPKRPRRTVTLQADDGEPVEIAIPRVCCILAEDARSHCCPTCPQQSATALRNSAEAWLRSMDDQEFFSETGRMRISSQGCE